MATNLGGNIGQVQNAVNAIGNLVSTTGTVVTMPVQQQQQTTTPQQQTVGTSIDTPMDIDSAMQTVSSVEVNLYSSSLFCSVCTYHTYTDEN
jgi:hypothetical protein